MGSFFLSGFADEMDASLDAQIRGLKDLDIGHIEVRGVDGRNISEYSPEEAKAIKQKLDAGGISVSAIGSPIGKIGILEDMDAHLALFQNVLEIAKVLEAPYIRLFSFFIPAGEDASAYRDEVLRRMERLVAAAKGSGITLLHENEKEIYGDTAERCRDILESIGSDGLRATFDPANFVQCGVAPFPHAYELLRPYIEYVHIKDATADGTVVPAGQGEGHVKELLAALKESGFSGFASLEPHLGNFTGFAALELDGALADLPEGGIKTFSVAADALRKILQEVDA